MPMYSSTFGDGTGLTLDMSNIVFDFLKKKGISIIMKVLSQLTNCVYPPK